MRIWADQPRGSGEPCPKAQSSPSIRHCLAGDGVGGDGSRAWQQRRGFLQWKGFGEGEGDRCKNSSLRGGTGCGQRAWQGCDGARELQLLIPHSLSCSRASPFGYVKGATWWWCLQGYLGAALRYQSAQVMQGSWQAVRSTAVHCKFWQS